ncbi:hypothetical protein T492DRAFT_1025318 [Pavlovales sp. CCMP2436]|nr:hypothetical protein T492DRAFT_1025318 [Pavlovales sp. CCMP2436]
MRRALAWALAVALARGEQTESPRLPLISSEEHLNAALAESPLLLVFFYRRLDHPNGATPRPDAPVDDLTVGVEGGQGTVRLAAEVATLASSFKNLVAAVDCGQTPQICADRRVTMTPAFKLWSKEQGRFTRYTGPQDRGALATFLRRKLVANAELEQPPPAGADGAAQRGQAAQAKPPSSMGMVGTCLALGLYALAVASDVASVLGVPNELVISGVVLGALLCGLLFVCLCGVRPEGRRRKQRVAILRGRLVTFDGGSGWLVSPTCNDLKHAAELASELPAVLLVGPLSPAGTRLRREQRLALEAVAMKVGARGYRCLLLDCPPRVEAVGESVAAVAAACEWLRAPPDGSRTVRARVGALGIGEGGQLLARAVRLAACPFDCVVAFELCGEQAAVAAARVAAVTSAPKAPKGRGADKVQPPAGAGGAATLLAAAVGEVGALASGARCPVQLHIDLLDGPLGGTADGLLPGSDREADARLYAAARLRASGNALASSNAPVGGSSRLFLYGVPVDGGAGSAYDEAKAIAELAGGAVAEERGAAEEGEALPLLMLLQPDGRRELGKGYIWMRASAFLYVHLAR